jgi:ribosomal protein L40E
MIVCPNCNHQNPDGATQCEACYTPLPTTTSCPNCGAAVQTDASFCGQCGFNLLVTHEGEEGETSTPDPAVPELVALEALVIPDPISIRSEEPDPMASPLPATIVGQPPVAEEEKALEPEVEELSAPEVASQPATATTAPPASSEARGSAKTQLQVQTVKLLHVQTNTNIEMPQNLSVIHMGKPNDQIPPDIDVSGFPHSEIVSRVHADIRVEGDAHYIEDVGSSNGTYINHNPLLPGNRHRLRTGDRISLGKGDLMTFLFQSSS